MKANKIIYFFLFIALIQVALAGMIECKGTVSPDEVPCLIFLPSGGITCSDNYVAVYNNASTLIYNQTLSSYNAFTCNATFNQTSEQTYTLFYSTGDTGSITVEEDYKMHFFNLTVYGLFTTAIFVLVYFMHKFNYEENMLSPIVFGSTATALCAITIAMLMHGGFPIVKGISFIININYYFIIIYLSLAIYCSTACFSLYRQIRKRWYSDYYGWGRRGETGETEY